jgi:hypothetical protein
MFGRRRPKPRKPHPDARVEAQLQKVLSRYAAIERAAGRLSDVRDEQKRVDVKYRDCVGYRDVTDITAQAERLRTERTDLEAFIARNHDENAKQLADLGDDALRLYEMED